MGHALSFFYLTLKLSKVRPSGGAAWGRVGPVRAEWGWGGVGHALHDSKTRPWLQGKWGRVGPNGAEYGRVEPVRVEWGWRGVGHALGFN